MKKIVTICIFLTALSLNTRAQTSENLTNYSPVVSQSSKVETSPNDGVVKTIDKRTMTEADGSVYYLVFIAKPTVLQGGENAGHAYVVWGKEDNTAQMSSAEAWGLYPINSLKTLTLGAVPGEIRQDGLNSVDYNRLIVKVDKSVYDAAMVAKNTFAENETYELLERDCLTFTIKMATVAQLIIPDRSGFDNIPWNYLISLINAN